METKSPLISSHKIVGDVLYTSGTISRSGDAPTQIRGCMEKLKQTLENVGASLETVIKATVYLANLEDRASLNEIWKHYFPTNPPCRTTVQVVLGPNILVEIEMIALIK